jgi:hypothetical protein
MGGGDVSPASTDSGGSRSSAVLPSSSVAKHYSHWVPNTAVRALLAMFFGNIPSPPTTASFACLLPCLRATAAAFVARVASTFAFMRTGKQSEERERERATHTHTHTHTPTHTHTTPTAPLVTGRGSDAAFSAVALVGFLLLSHPLPLQRSQQRSQPLRQANAKKQNQARMGAAKAGYDDTADRSEHVTVLRRALEEDFNRAETLRREMHLMVGPYS